MTDTPPEIERMVRERIMARSAEERFLMGAHMFDAAREMICASLPPDLLETDRKRRLFERIYGATAAPWSEDLNSRFPPSTDGLKKAGC
jgi:hypothetical protein